ncbi:MAG TPA: hypothetical protein VK634_02645 [Reyranella sp.]|nr:hypothetical protein [Reyranella sp.]
MPVDAGGVEYASCPGRRGNSTNQVPISVALGNMRFIDVEMQPGQYVCTIREADPGAGCPAVLNGSRGAQCDERRVSSRAQLGLPGWAEA